MAGEKIPFSCTTCKAVNKVPLESIKNKVGIQRIILICGDCGRVNEPQKIEKSEDQDHSGENFLACIPFTGPEKDLPTGSITVAGRTLWTTATGKSFTTEEFIMRFGLHPGIFSKKKIIDDQAVQKAFLLGHPAVAHR